MKTAIALGTFDGVHLGHKEVLRLPEGLRKTAILFREPPKMADQKKKEMLTLPEQKLALLREAGIEAFEELDFKTVKNMPPEAFLAHLKELDPMMISCGFNYRFGKDGLGDAAFLQRFCAANGIVLRCCEPVTAGGEIVSSTRIRNLLKSGKVEQANALLGRAFGFSAPVISGDQRGRTIGFPTVNQRYPDGLVAVRFGVYAVTVRVEGTAYAGIANIGVRPTYPTNFILSETYIDGFSGDLYGKELALELNSFIRPEKKFRSVEELKARIQQDLALLKIIRKS